MMTVKMSSVPTEEYVTRKIDSGDYSHGDKALATELAKREMDSTQRVDCRRLHPDSKIQIDIEDEEIGLSCSVILHSNDMYGVAMLFQGSDEEDEILLHLIQVIDGEDLSVEIRHNDRVHVEKNWIIYDIIWQRDGGEPVKLMSYLVSSIN